MLLLFFCFVSLSDSLRTELSVSFHVYSLLFFFPSDGSRRVHSKCSDPLGHLWRVEVMECGRYYGTVFFNAIKVCQ